MSATTSLAGTIQTRRARRRLSLRVLSGLRRSFQAVHDVWDGSSWTPGRDWLTRVEGANGRPTL
jgi:hypothetical protein